MNINSNDTGLTTLVYACNFDASTVDYTLLVDKPKNCEGSRPSSGFLDFNSNAVTRIQVRDRFPRRTIGRTFPKTTEQKFLHRALGCVFEYPEYRDDMVRYIEVKERSKTCNDPQTSIH
jgi:hypothetical protein